MTKHQDEALAFCRLTRVHHGRKKRILEVAAVKRFYNIIHVHLPDAVSGCRADILSRFARKGKIYFATVMRGTDDDDDDEDQRLIARTPVKMSFARPPRDAKLSPLASSSARRTGISSRRQSRSDSRDAGSVRQPLPTQDVNVISDYGTTRCSHTTNPRDIEGSDGSTEV